ncbi:unnamed protein product [Echinostoma caproni]|uniref:Transposase n=1 Tax=Echinostoma caproni TaxID=27848 RepID=A0A183BEK9_9TREM|nr:unnamed protein product [Echinostoma caproni]
MPQGKPDTGRIVAVACRIARHGSEMECSGQINVPPYPTDLIRLEIDGGRCSYFPQLDAILLTGFAQVYPLGWPGYTQLENGITDLDVDASTYAAQDPAHTACTPTQSSPALAFFADLLRPRAPQICLPASVSNHLFP